MESPLVGCVDAESPEWGGLYKDGTGEGIVQKDYTPDAALAPWVFDFLSRVGRRKNGYVSMGCPNEIQNRLMSRTMNSRMP